MRSIVVAALGVLVAVAPESATAQPTKPVAVTLGYPAALGLIWHVNDRLAVRPDVTANRSETSSTVTSTTATLLGTSAVSTTTTQTDWTTSAGLSLLVTLADIDDLRLYLVPRVAYLRSKTTSEANSLGLGPFDATNDGVLVAGGFGAHYMLGTRAAVFGEGTVQYNRQTFSSGFAGSGTESKLTAVGLRAAVGFAVYF